MEKVSKQPLISVVIPVYKVEQYLDKCVESVVNQTYDKLEIILVDDGSPDNCPKKCDDWKKKDKRIKVIHKSNGGLSDARNKGIEESNGELITFIDSDDYVTLNYIEFLYNNLVKYDADISIGKHYIVFPKKTVSTATGNIYSNLTKEKILEKLLYSEDFDVSTWAKLYKKELFNNIKFPIGRSFEDSATTYKLIDIAEKTIMVSEPIYYYVIRDNSITTNRFSEKKVDLITSTEEMVNYIEKKYPRLEKACKRRMMYAYLSTYGQYVKSNARNKKIKKYLLSYIKSNRKKVLKDKRIPGRDRKALLITYLGHQAYKIAWKLYVKRH